MSPCIEIPTDTTQILASIERDSANPAFSGIIQEAKQAVSSRTTFERRVEVSSSAADYLRYLGCQRMECP